MKYIMGLDLGTTGCKATVFDQDGHIVIQAYEEYPIEHYTGMIDPAMVWEKTQAVISVCTKQQPVVEAICTTSFGESVIPVDKNKCVLGDSILYTSAGVEEEWQELSQKLGEERLAQITGHISHPMYTINRLMWYRKHEKELYQQTEQFLFFSSYIIMKLCGICCAENTQAARSMAYDVHLGRWSREITDAAGFDASKFPPIVCAGDILGTVTDDQKEVLGFHNLPVVVAGGQDQPCVALGMGAIHGADAVYGLGTVECLSVVMDQYTQTSEMIKAHLVCAPHVIPGKYLTYGVLYSGGNVIKEIRNRCYTLERKQDMDVYPLMFSEMEEAETKLLFIPHLLGSGTPYMEQDDSGSLLGLRMETKRGEIVRAAIQGLAFDMRINIENMEKNHIPVRNIKTAGGGAKSMDALQIRANAIQKSLFLPTDVQAGTRGVFFIAAKAMGWILDFEHISDYGIEKGAWIFPQEDNSRNYEEKYMQYKKVSEMIRLLKKPM